MKKSELILGNYYAYNRSRDNNPTWITKVKLVDLESERGYRSKSNTVGVEFTQWRGYGDNREEYKSVEYVQLYTLKGDYDTVAHEIELRKKDAEIRSLRSEIERKRKIDIQREYKQAFIEFGISQYNFREYGMDLFRIDFSEEQFKTVSRLLATYNKDLAEAKAQAEETANA